jgi:hypothetical protein
MKYMKISRNQLRRIISEESHNVETVPPQDPAAVVAQGEEASIAEAINELVLVQRHLTMANESVETAAALLEGCDDPNGTCHVPLVEAVQTQIGALTETVAAEANLLKTVSENGANKTAASSKKDD